MVTIAPQGSVSVETVEKISSAENGQSFLQEVSTAKEVQDNTERSVGETSGAVEANQDVFAAVEKREGATDEGNLESKKTNTKVVEPISQLPVLKEKPKALVPILEGDHRALEKVKKELSNGEFVDAAIGLAELRFLALQSNTH